MEGKMARITVTPASEDEVIYAGVQSGSQTGSEAADEVTAPAAAVPAADGRTASGPASLKAPKRQAASSKAREKDAYREPTLEDLEPTPMPIAQRIVIVAAVVCIIGALVYYFVAMR